MKYKYQGMNRARQLVQGEVEARTLEEARQQLRSREILARSLEAANRDGLSLEKIAQIKITSGVSGKQIMLFMRQFSSLVDAGVPIVQCLDILFAQERNKIFKQVIGDMKRHVEAGGGLAESMARHEDVFSNFMIRIIEAGEVSGTLDEAFHRASTQIEKLGKLKNKVVSALLYPALTMALAVCTVVFLLIKVVPEITKLYGGNQLPDVTMMVLAVSTWMQNYYGYGIGGVIAAVVLFALFYQQEEFRKQWDPLVLKTPLVGDLILKSSIAKLTRTMATLVRSGVPLLQTFDVCTRISGNYAVKDAIQLCSRFVKEGKTIASGLAVAGIFPPMLVQMVNIGEMTGKLDEMLGKVADIYDDEVDNAVGNMTGLLQPLLIVGVGVVIMFILISMYLPIMQLGEKMAL